ncbi:MAG: N-acetyltransferase [Gammaproteobacteria bacterium]|nr:N-acetyltransferase [Gammaproteobacteria bacterium]
MQISVHDSMDSIAAGHWNRLAGGNPFLQHQFLAALEHNGCAGTSSGWRPQHLTCADAAGKLIGALPLYLKSHSYGEYVFDWAWAGVYQRAGLAYYPKLVCAAPFSPVTGPRLLVDAQASREAVSQALIRAALSLAEEHAASSIHCLFPAEREAREWTAHGFMLRKDCQFHWHNHAYQRFEDFLAALSAEKRKKIKRERRRVAEAGVHHLTLSGHDLDDAALDTLQRFYASTYGKRGRPAYLNRAFFAEISRTLADALVVIFAFKGAQPLAAAVCFRDADTLYGRHWGCEQEFHSLHFETCYYQGIEYCLRQGLKHFNPGTQGEHKLARGFEPTATWSAHWIAEPAFRSAIGDYLRREIAAVDAYMADAGSHLPFRADI